MDKETIRKDKTQGSNYNKKPDSVMQSLVAAFLPDIIEFLSTKASRREYEEWLRKCEMKPRK